MGTTSRTDFLRTAERHKDWRPMTADACSKQEGYLKKKKMVCDYLFASSKKIIVLIFYNSSNDVTDAMGK